MEQKRRKGTYSQCPGRGGRSGLRRSPEGKRQHTHLQTRIRVILSHTGSCKQQRRVTVFAAPPRGNTHLEDSTAPTPPASSASSPGLPLGFPGSCSSSSGGVGGGVRCVCVCLCRRWRRTLAAHTHLLVCLWCWMTRFFSWTVSSSAVASDFRSAMDRGVAGRLQRCSSRSISWTEAEEAGSHPGPLLPIPNSLRL